MKELRITHIQRGCIYDGPGIRTVVFLKGCNLRCPWCCNPEAQSFDKEYFISEADCLLNSNINSFICSTCNRRGGTDLIEKCPLELKTSVSRDYSTDQLIRELLIDSDLFADSKGGVTFSGGEPLLYIEELKPTLEILKSLNISIYFETSLVCPKSAIETALSYANGIIIDLKIQPELNLLLNNEYRDMVKNTLKQAKDNNIDIINRLVFVDSLLDELNEISTFLNYTDISSIQLLKCHNMASNKYIKLGRESLDFSPSQDNFNRFAYYFNITDILC